MGEILKKAVEDLNKIYGKGTVISFTDKSTLPVIEKTGSGSIGLDLALGGGYAKGRIIEMYGPESSGKTTLALHAIAESQKLGKDCGFIDAEQALDLHYAQKIGVDTNKLLISQPENGEQALEILEKLVRTNELGVIVIDSVAALIPKAEIDGEMGDSKMGLHARLMSQAMRKLVSAVNKSNCLVIFINQLRDKIGIVFGDPSVTTGGNALKFYATQRLDIRRIAKLKDKNENFYGNRVKVNVVKNKTAPPFQIAEFNIIYGKGIDKVEEILNIAVELEVIKVEGSTHSYQDIKLGSGKDEILNLLNDNEELIKEIEYKLLAKLGFIELSEEEQKRIDEEEINRRWNKLEERIKMIVEKYKVIAEDWLINIKSIFTIEISESLNKLTDYALSQQIKLFKK